MKKIALSVGAALAASVVSTGPVALASDRPTAKAIRLESGGSNYLPLLQGPPETVSMRSGLVTLAPGKSVGKHSTKGNEEILVVLDGRGEMRITGGATLPFGKETALYCPPNTEHDVVNTGTATLRYVYVVSKAAN